MADFTIDGVAYKSDLFDGAQQVLILKRLLPAFTALIGVAPSLASGEDGPLTFPEFAVVLEPVAKALAELPDREVEVILNSCIDVTSRQVANGIGWVKVRQGGVIQDRADSKFATRLKIAWNVIGENFADMFASFGIDLRGLMGKVGVPDV